MTRVVVVEDRTLVRQSVVKTINAEEGVEVVAGAGRGDEGLAQIAKNSPDVVLLDITMPGGNGLEVAAQMRSAAPNSRFLFLTMHDDDVSISKAIALGADGYVLKTASTDELLTALRAIAEGGSYLSPAVARRVIDLAGGKSPSANLTDRELEILRLLASGARPGQVAEWIAEPMPSSLCARNTWSRLGTRITYRCQTCSLPGTTRGVRTPGMPLSISSYLCAAARRASFHLARCASLISKT